MLLYRCQHYLQQCLLMIYSFLVEYNMVTSSPKKNSVDSTQPNPDSQQLDSLPPNDNQDKRCDVPVQLMVVMKDHHILVEMKDLQSTGINAKT